jgi:hypothetical protein
MVSGSGPHYISSGNVGIGTTAPRTNLDVSGQILATGVLRVEGYTTPPSGAGVELGYTGGNAYVTGYNRTSSSYTPLILRGDDLILQEGGTEVMRIASGNVGIGTTSPDRKLRVEGTGYFYSGGELVDLLSRSDSTLDIIQASGSTKRGLSIHTYGTGNLMELWYNDGTSWYNRFTVQKGGNVGIGTTGPTAKLDVRASASPGARFFDSGGNLVLELDESTSPIYWEQYLSSQFVLGQFFNTTVDTSKDQILLKEKENGTFYSTGTYISAVRDTGGVAQFDTFRAMTILPPSTKIIAFIEVSDDNFATIKDSKTIELKGDFETFSLESLAFAKYVRVKFDFSTDDPSTTPRLASFEVWYYLDTETENSNFFGKMADFNSSPLAMVETSGISPNYIPKMLDNHIITQSAIYERENGVNVAANLNVHGEFCLNQTCINQGQLEKILSTLNLDEKLLEGKEVDIKSQSIIQLVKTSIKEILSSLTGRIEAAGEWIFEKIFVKIAVIEKVELKSGMTIYDKKTGEPYCVEVENGNLILEKGKCGEEEVILRENSSSETKENSEEGSVGGETINENQTQGSGI